MLEQTQRGYAHPEALVSTHWLAANRQTPSVRIFDASFTLPDIKPTAKETYARQHIEGASFFDIDAIADRANPLPHMLPDEAQFATAMGALGARNDDRIIVYDATGFNSAPRAWWMIRAFGHSDVAILEGGLAKWLAEGKPVTAAIPKPAPTTFNAKLDRVHIRSKQDVLDNLAHQREQVVDARSVPRFTGMGPEPRPGLRPGHIPHSINLPYESLARSGARTLLPAAEIEQCFLGAGVDRSKPVVVSCGSGVTACALAFGLHLIGWPEPSLYDGSWAEWGLPGATPVIAGPGDETHPKPIN